jgi:hypothetical protein
MQEQGIKISWGNISAIGGMVVILISFVFWFGTMLQSINDRISTLEGKQEKRFTIIETKHDSLAKTVKSNTIEIQKHNLLIFKSGKQVN